MEYRVMEERDIPKVIPLYMDYYNARGDEWTAEIVHHRVWQVLGSPDAYCLMAEEDGEVIGFAMGRFERFYDLNAYNLVEIIIAEPYQNRGLGTTLMRELERRVKAAGAALVQLMAVNDEAHDRFYERLGYRNTANLVLKGRFL